MVEDEGFEENLIFKNECFVSVFNKTQNALISIIYRHCRTEDLIQAQLLQVILGGVTTKLSYLTVSMLTTN